MTLDVNQLMNDPDFQPVWNKLYEQLGRKQGAEIAKQMDLKDVDPNMFEYFMKGFSDAIREACMLEHMR